VTKKKILLLSSYGGYGHMAAANTLRELVGDEYTFDVAYPIKEVRFCGVPSGESLYNYCLGKNWTRFMNLVVKHLPHHFFAKSEKKIQKQIEAHIERYRPDMVISLIPYVNFPAQEAARTYSLPFLLVTTDNELKKWVFNLEKKQYSLFKTTIGHNLPTSKGRLLKCGVPEEMIETTGLPLRPSFLSGESKEVLRQKYEIPQSKKVVLVVMGGLGAHTSYLYAKAIGKSALNVHLIVCIGKQKHLAQKLKKLKLAPGNSIDLIPFTEKVHELFFLSDLLITKSGPGTMIEAFASKLPILIDQTKESLFWEKPNIDLVLSRKVGSCIYSYKEAPELVRKYLYDKEVSEAVAKAYESIEPNRFADRIKSLLEEMCAEPMAGEVVMTSRSVLKEDPLSTSFMKEFR